MLVKPKTNLTMFNSQDLEAYANNYSGLGRLYRLIFIADHCASLRVEALKMALSHVMQTYNVALYQKIYNKLVNVSAYVFCIFMTYPYFSLFLNLWE